MMVTNVLLSTFGAIRDGSKFYISLRYRKAGCGVVAHETVTEPRVTME